VTMVTIVEVVIVLIECGNSGSVYCMLPLTTEFELNPLLFLVI
jgi:hypothetical protein